MQDRIQMGQFIRQLREENEMTQKQLAEQLFVTSQAVSKWEKGLSFPDIALFEELAAALHITVLELMRGQKSTTDITLSTEAETVVNHMLLESEKNVQTLQKRIRKVSMLLLGILAGTPIAIAALSGGGFYLLHNEKNLEEALLTLCFVCLAAVGVFIQFSLPLFGILLTGMIQKSTLFCKKFKIKKPLCYLLYAFFLGWIVKSIVILFFDFGI